jgi:hypothetical protein
MENAYGAAAAGKSLEEHVLFVMEQVIAVFVRAMGNVQSVTGGELFVVGSAKVRARNCFILGDNNTF